MALLLDNAIRTSRAQAIIDAIDAGAAAGTVRFYTGPQPAKGAAITTETLIGTLTMTDPSGTIASGVLTFSSITDDSSADATGEIAWGRVQDSNGTFVMDGDCGLDASGAVFEFNTLSATIGGVIQITSMVFTEGNN